MKCGRPTPAFAAPASVASEATAASATSGAIPIRSRALRVPRITVTPLSAIPCDARRGAPLPLVLLAGGPCNPRHGEDFALEPASPAQREGPAGAGPRAKRDAVLGLAQHR